MSRPALTAALAALLLLAACGGGSSDGAPTAAATATPPPTEATPTATPDRTPTSGELPRTDDPVRLGPVEQEPPSRAGAAGLTFIDTAAAAAITLPAPAPEPIDFRAGALLVRDGVEFALLDFDLGEVARVRAFGPTPATDWRAPGVRPSDLEVSPTLDYFVEQRRATDDLTYELVLVEVASGDATVVATDRRPCQCDPIPASRWSASGRYFLDAATDALLIVDTEDLSARVVPAVWTHPSPNGNLAVWSPVADELLLVGPDGVSLLEVSTWERSPVTGEVDALRFTADGSQIAVVSDVLSDPQTTIFERATLEAVTTREGLLEDAVTLPGGVLLALAETPFCPTGIEVTGPGATICFEDAVNAALAPNGAVALAYRSVVPVAGSAGGSMTTWSVETFEPGQLRATVHQGPTTEDGAGPIFMLWSDDGQQLALYWPWRFGV